MTQEKDQDAVHIFVHDSVALFNGEVDLTSLSVKRDEPSLRVCFSNII